MSPLWSQCEACVLNTMPCFWSLSYAFGTASVLANSFRPYVMSPHSTSKYYTLSKWHVILLFWDLVSKMNAFRSSFEQNGGIEVKQYATTKHMSS